MQTHPNLEREDSAKNSLPSPEFVLRMGQWTSFPCNLVHKVLTSALITLIYRQNLLH